MARETATTKSTGGGGYTFADQVAAGFLAQILKRAFPLETEFGPIIGLHFETRESGQILDNLLLILQPGTRLDFIAHKAVGSPVPIEIQAEREKMVVIYAHSIRGDEPAVASFSPVASSAAVRLFTSLMLSCPDAAIRTRMAPFCWKNPIANVVIIVEGRNRPQNQIEHLAAFDHASIIVPPRHRA